MARRWRHFWQQRRTMRPARCRRYEGLRKPRATRLQEASAVNRVRFHLPDGPEQQARDAGMAKGGDRSLDNIAWLYDHDAADTAP